MGKIQTAGHYKRLWRHHRKLLKHFGHQFSFTRYEDHAIFYKMEKDDLSIPAVTTCIRVDADLHVRLCCDHMLTKSCSSADRNYVQLLSRGGLKHPSAALSNFVAHGLAMLHATSDLIRKSRLSSRLAGEEILKSCLHSEGFVCEKHEQSAYEKTIRTISNVFFNNQRKRNSETVVKQWLISRNPNDVSHTRNLR